MGNLVKYEQAKPWVKIKVGKNKYEALIKKIQDSKKTGFYPHYGQQDAKDLILCSDKPSRKEAEYELASLSVRQLGFREEDFPEADGSWNCGPTYKQACDRAVELDFKLCTTEIATSFCASAEFSYGELHKTRGARFAMVPVICSDWKAKILHLYEDNLPFSMPQLFAIDIKPESKISLDSGLIFCL